MTYLETAPDHVTLESKCVNIHSHPIHPRTQFEVQTLAKVPL
jgi:hypothetical protein